MTEHEDYEIVPDHENAEVWNIRILKGEYVETIIRYGAISFAKGSLRFSFRIIDSPDPDLTTADEAFQLYAGELLEDILAQSMKDGSIITKER